MIVALLLASAAPARIVSNNPCIDAMLAEMARPGQIVAISHYSRDPRASSVDRGWASHFPTIGDTAEEVVLARPDLFITSAPMPLATARAVQRAGIRTLTLPLANSIAESREQIVRVAAAIGNPGAGARLNQHIDAAIRAARWNGAPADALIWMSGGMVPGPGSIADEMFRLSGWRSAAARYGARGWETIALERVALAPPRVIFSPGGDRMLARRAAIIRRLNGQTRIVDFPDTMLFCAGPTIIRALDTLAAARRAVK